MFCNGYLGIPAACFPKNKRPAPRKRAAKKITHVDNIRKMTNEELAEWLAMIEISARAKGNPKEFAQDELSKMWLDWLEEDAK